MLQGFPVLLVGSTDKRKRFRPFGIAVAHGETAKDFQFIFESVKETYKLVTKKEYNPAILIADGSEQITKGFAYQWSAFTGSDYHSYYDSYDEKKYIYSTRRNIKDPSFT